MYRRLDHLHYIFSPSICRLMTVFGGITWVQISIVSHLGTVLHSFPRDLYSTWSRYNEHIFIWIIPVHIKLTHNMQLSFDGLLYRKHICTSPMSSGLSFTLLPLFHCKSHSTLPPLFILSSAAGCPLWGFLQLASWWCCTRCLLQPLEICDIGIPGDCRRRLHIILAYVRMVKGGGGSLPMKNATRVNNKNSFS